ncbi:MAG: fasciclin domain-containing protein, partial [Caulobacter sp.]|nr:fasciclin domain-containing protein [Caulobacter sp.]
AAAPATPAAPAAGAPTAGAPTAGSLVAKGDIVDTLKASGKFTVLLRGLDATNLTTLLKTNKNLTLFAPTDAAFAALPDGELARLEANPTELQKVLTYHLINASVDSSKVKGAKGAIATVAGPQITLDGSGAAIMAGDATITQADVKATNGIVHVIDKVLMPTGTPVAANMTTDTPQGRIIRASWQEPAQPTEPMEQPATEAEDPAMPAEPAPAAPAVSPEMPATPATPATPADPSMAPATPADPATSVAAATAAPAQVNNGPVLDTAENRAKYPPLSRAGKRTPAKGNR